MKMRVMLTALLGGLALLVAAGSNNAAVAEDPDISTIMKKVNSGKTALKATMKAGLTAKQPDWDVLKTSAEQLTELAVALGKNKQPKGPDESWKKLTGLYAENAKAWKPPSARRMPRLATLLTPSSSLAAPVALATRFTKIDFVIENESIIRDRQDECPDGFFIN